MNATPGTPDPAKLQEALRILRAIGKETGDNVKHLSDYREGFEDITDEIRTMDKQIRKLHWKSGLPLTRAVELQRKLNDINKRLMQTKKISRGLDVFRGLKAQKDQLKALSRESGKLRDELNLMGEASEGAGKLMKSGNYVALFEKAGESLSGMPGMFKMMGGAAKGMGSALGGISKMMAGWPGAIFMAAKAIWDMGMAADQFVKDANKQFAMVRGPDIMTKNIKGQFKDFNKQIFNMRDNLKVGLNVAQIREFMGAVNQAGLNITTLNKGVSTYRDAIYVAAKASRILGTDLTYTGSAMAKMITDFRMDLDQTDKAFTQVAFDAKKSGLSTDRFWGTVQNASASLALYGVALGTTSKILKRFTEDQIGGADEAAAATENMMEVFKTGSLENSAALIDFAKIGGSNVNQMFKDIRGGLEKEMADIQYKITAIEAKGGKKTPADVEAIKQLRKEMITKQTKANRYLEMVGKNSVTQATEMGALSKEAPELLLSAIKNISGVSDLTQISGDRTWVAIKSLEKFGVHEKTVRSLIEEARVSKEMLIGASENLKNLNETDKEILKQAAEVDPRIQSELEALNAATDPAEKREHRDILKSLLTSSEMIDKVTKTRFKTQEVTDKELADNADSTFKEIVSQTLSYNEMLEIAKNDIEYRTKSLGFLQGINTGVMGIFKKYVTGKVDTPDENQAKIIRESMAGIKNLTPEIAGLKRAVESGDIVEELSKLQKELADTKDVEKKKELETAIKALKVPVENMLKYQKGGLAAVGLTGETDIAKVLKESQHGTLSKKERADKLLLAQKMVQEKLLDKAKNDLSNSEKQLIKLKDTVTELQSLNSTNTKIAQMQEIMLKSNPEAMAEIADQIQEQVAGGSTLKEALQTVGVDAAMGIKAMEAKKGLTGLDPAFSSTYEKLKKQIKTEGSVSKGMGSMIPSVMVPGINRDVRAVLKEGFVPLSRGDLVVDQNELGKAIGGSKGSAIPLLAEAASKAAPAGTGGSKNIYINVTATEKDLAQKITNEIRAELYKQQLN